MHTITLYGCEFEILNRDVIIGDGFKIENIKQVRITKTDRKISFKIPLNEKQFYEFVDYAFNAWLLEEI